MSCIITYKGQKYSEEQFKEYFINNKQEFATSIAKNKDVIDSFKRKMEGIDFVFSQSPELASIGSKAQYLQYLSTIFKTSKLKDIVYHGTDKEFDTFKKPADVGSQNRMIAFADDIEYAKIAGARRTPLKKVISALVNINTLYPIDKLEAMELDSGFRDEVLNELKKEGVDGFAFESDDDLATKTFNEVLVFDPEQIHILGSKQDIERFKQFVNKPTFDKELAQEKSKDKLITKLFSFLENYNFQVKTVDDLMKHTGHDASGTTDLIYKTILINSNGNQEELLTKEVAYVAYSLLGRTNKIRTDLMNSISNIDNYAQIYSEYKTASPNLSDYKIKELIVVDFISDSIKENYKYPKDSYINREADYWSIKGNTSLEKKIKYILNKLKKFIGDLLGINKLTSDELNELFSDLANDVLNNISIKFNKELSPNQQLTNYDETVSKDPKAKEIIESIQELGILLTGSLSLRKQGTIYRSNETNVHDLDFTVPYSVFEQDILEIENQREQEIENIKKQFLPGSPEINRWISAIQSKYERTTDEIVEQSTWFQSIKSKYPSLKKVRSFGGSLESQITWTGLIDDTYLVDFFLTSNDKLGVENNNNFQNWQSIFKAKLKMGRKKDLNDYINYIPFKTNNTYFSRDKGFRHFNFEQLVIPTTKPFIEEENIVFQTPKPPDNNRNLNTKLHNLGLRDLKISNNIYDVPIKSISNEAAFRNILLQIVENPSTLNDIDFTKYLSKEDIEKVNSIKSIAQEFGKLNMSLDQNNNEQLKKYVELNTELNNFIINTFTPYLKQFGQNVQFETINLKNVVDNTEKGVSGDFFTKKNIFTVTPIKSVDKKATIKASISTQYIGFGEGIVGSSTESYRQQVDNQYKEALEEANKRPSETNIPQNLQSGVEQYGTLQFANNKAQTILGKNVTSIEMIESGFRTRTTRTDAELEKYNIKVGSYIKMFGKDQFGNTKNIIVKITKITKGYDDINWYKEGWTQEGLQKLKNHTNSANAVEFEVVRPANSGNYSVNDVIFVSVPGRRGTAEQQKTQQDRTINEVLKALEAGATIIADNKSYIDGNSYNTGEKRLYDNLKAKGYIYSEVTVDGQLLGVWNKQTDAESVDINAYTGKVFFDGQDGNKYAFDLANGKPTGGFYKQNRGNWLELASKNVVRKYDLLKASQTVFFSEKELMNPTAATTPIIQGIEISSSAIGLGNDLTNVHYAVNGKTKFDIKPSRPSLRDPFKVRLDESDLAVKWAINRGLSSYGEAYGHSVEAWYKANSAKMNRIPEGFQGDEYDMNLMVSLITDKLIQYPNLLGQITERGGVDFLSKSTHSIGRGRWSSNNPKNMFIEALKFAYEDALYKQSKALVKSNTNIQLNEQTVEDEFTDTTVGNYIFTFKNGFSIKTPFQFNEEQQKALEDIEDFINDPLKYNNKKALIGYAGTGKTTLMRAVDQYVRNLKRDIVYSSPTHRANAQTSKAVGKHANVKTIHSLLGLKALYDFENEVISLDKIKFGVEEGEAISDKYKNHIIVIDESSLMQKSLYDYMNEMSQLGATILFVGDDAQLPPPNEYKSKVFSDPNLHKSFLTKVERTGDNAILEESMNVRNGKPLLYQTKLKDGIGTAYLHPNVSNDFEQEQLDHVRDLFSELNPDKIRILAATKKRVSFYNNYVRGLLFDNTDIIHKGEILTAYDNVGDVRFETDILRNSFDYIVVNDPVKTVVNYEGFSISAYKVLLRDGDGKIYTFHIQDNLEEYKRFVAAAQIVLQQYLAAKKIGDKRTAGKLYAKYKNMSSAVLGFEDIHADVKGALFSTSELEAYGLDPKKFPIKAKKAIDFGYALTIHKSQGGTFDNVVYDKDSINSFLNSNDRQSLEYVAISRARHKLFIVTTQPLKHPVVEYTNKSAIEDVNFEDVNDDDINDDNVDFIETISYTLDDVQRMFEGVDMFNITPENIMSIESYLTSTRGSKVSLTGYTNIDDMLADGFISPSEHNVLMTVGLVEEMNDIIEESLIEDNVLEGESISNQKTLNGLSIYDETDFTRDNKGNIIDLPENYIFGPFGSNTGSSTGLPPTHGAGSAKIAKEKFGAIQGNPRGLQNRSYAIVTKKYYDIYRSSTPDEILMEIKEFYDFAERHPELKFVVIYAGNETKLENNSGYTNVELGILFGTYIPPSNVLFEKEFSNLVVSDGKVATIEPSFDMLNALTPQMFDEISDGSVTSYTRDFSDEARYTKKHYYKPRKAGDNVMIYDGQRKQIVKAVGNWVPFTKIDKETWIQTSGFDEATYDKILKSPKVEDMRVLFFSKPSEKEQKQEKQITPKLLLSSKVEPEKVEPLKFDKTTLIANPTDLRNFLNTLKKKVEDTDKDIENQYYAPIIGQYPSLRYVPSHLKAIDLTPVKDTYKVVMGRKYDKVTDLTQQLFKVQEQLQITPGDPNLIAQRDSLTIKIEKINTDIRGIKATVKNIMKNLYVDEIHKLYEEDVRTLRNMLLSPDLDLGLLSEGLEIIKMWQRVSEMKVQHPFFNQTIIEEYHQGTAAQYVMAFGSYFESRKNDIDALYNSFLSTAANLMEDKISEEYGESVDLLNDTFSDSSTLGSLFLSLNRADHPIANILHRKQKLAEWNAKKEVKNILDKLESLIDTLNKDYGSIKQAFEQLKEKFDDGKLTGSLVHEFTFDWNYDLSDIIENIKKVKDMKSLTLRMSKLANLNSDYLIVDVKNNNHQNYVDHLVNVIGYDRDIAEKYWRLAEQKYQDFLIEKQIMENEYGAGTIEFNMWLSRNEPNLETYISVYHPQPALKIHPSSVAPTFKYMVIIPSLTSGLSQQFLQVKSNQALYEFFSHIVEMQQSLVEILPEHERDKYFGNNLPFSTKDLTEALIDGSIGYSTVKDAYTNTIVEDSIEDISLYDIDGNKEETIMMRYSPLNKKRIATELSLKMTIFDMAHDQLRQSDPVLYNSKRQIYKREAFKQIVHNIAEEKSYDVGSVLKKFALFVYSYKYKLEMIDYHRAAEELFNESQVNVTNIANNPVSRLAPLPHSNRGKKVVKKNSLNNMMETLETQKRSFYNFHMYDHMHVGGKRYLESEKQLIKEIEEAERTAQDQLQQTGDAYYQKVLDKLKEEKDKLGRNVVHDNKVDELIKLTQLLGLGWGIIGGVSNVIQAVTSSLIMAGSSLYYDESSYFKALKSGLHSMLKNYTFNVVETDTAKRTRNLMDYYDVLKESKNAVYERTSSTVGFWGKLKKKFAFAKFYNASTRGEYFAQSIQFNAMLLFMKAYDPTGMEVTLNDAVADDGRVKQGYVYIYTNEQDGSTVTMTDPLQIENQIKIMVDDMIMRSQGNYSSDSPISVQKTIYGRAFINFKKWIFENTNERIGPEMFNRESGKITKGRYRSAIPLALPLSMLFNYLPLPIVIPTNKMMEIKTVLNINKYALQRILKVITLGKVQTDESVFNGMEPVDIRNIKASMNEALLHMSIVAVMMALKYLYVNEDDKNNLRLLKFLVNLINRTRQDIELYLNYDQLKDTIGTYDKIFPVLGNIEKLDKVLDSVVAQFGDNPDFQSGYWKDHNKLLINTLRFVPGVNKTISYPQYFDRILDADVAKQFADAIKANKE